MEEGVVDVSSGSWHSNDRQNSPKTFSKSSRTFLERLGLVFHTTYFVSNRIRVILEYYDDDVCVILEYDDDDVNIRTTCPVFSHIIMYSEDTKFGDMIDEKTSLTSQYDILISKKMYFNVIIKICDSGDNDKSLTYAIY